MNSDLLNRTCSFLSDLENNNDRAWFEANRSRYEAEWMAFAQDCVESLAPRMASLTPPHKAEAKVNKSIRRINRDVRFSKDKRPYDPRLHLVFWAGAHPNKSPAIHLVLYPTKLAIGGGHWAMTPQELDRYRQAVVQDNSGAELFEITQNCRAQGLDLLDETLKQVPKGLAVPEDRATFLKRKALVITSHKQPRSPEDLLTPDKLAPAILCLASVNAWLLSKLAA